MVGSSWSLLGSHVLWQVAVQHSTQDQPIGKGGGAKLLHLQTIVLHLRGEPGTQLICFTQTCNATTSSTSSATSTTNSCELRTRETRAQPVGWCAV